jgi:hypothetical protein
MEGSKEGVHSCMDRPALPQNHGPKLKTLSLSLVDSKTTTKNPFAQGQVVTSPSRSGYQSEEIQERRSERLG